MKRYERKYGWLLILCMFCISLSAQNADTILKQAAETYGSSNGIAAGFAIHASVEGQGSESSEGMIQMRNDRFKLTLPDMIIWFDGKTQWVYVERNDEVNVTTPSGDELQYTNPMVLLQSYQTGFNAKIKGESSSPNGRMAYDVELTPKKKGDIEKVDLQIEKATHYPARISVKAKNGVSTSIRIYELKTEQNQPDDFFVFKKEDFPDAEIIDLR